jgi:ornithine decarboxylase
LSTDLDAVTGTAARLAGFVADHPELPTPYLVMDLQSVRERYGALREALPRAEVYYAVKANPDREVLELLASLGSYFDVASLGEIDLCLAAGIPADRLSYGNTIKKSSDIAAAYARGVRIYAVDTLAELGKVLAHVHEGTVVARLACDGEGADWPLSRKFGATEAEVTAQLVRAASAGLDVGVSFHVGSQQRDPSSWDAPLAAVARLRDALVAAGHKLQLVNLGGGMPSQYVHHIPPAAEYGAHIRSAIERHLGNAADLDLMVEPGRYLVGDAGQIRAEVVLVADRDSDDGRRWVYLDLGIFNGLAEAMDGAIRYRISCPTASGPLVPCVVAGPTCDSIDVLYEVDPYPLPADLAAGDPIDIHATGAYTGAYSTAGFNGFAPLATYYLPA